MMTLENRKHYSKIVEVAEDQKRVGFAVKAMTDALPPNIGFVEPSEDCKTEKSGKYRALMRALRLPEDNNVAMLAQNIGPSTMETKECTFDWGRGDVAESKSYKKFRKYLSKEFNLNAVDISEGQGLADKLLYVSDIYTLRPRLNDLTVDLKKYALEPQFRFRLRGRTDLGAFIKGGILSVTDLLIGFEVKPKKKFSGVPDINRALREGVLQLIGCNADNHYTSPVIIVTAFTDKHYLLYLDISPNPTVELRYYLRVKFSTSLATLIAYALSVTKRGCVTARFCAPPYSDWQPARRLPCQGEWR